MLDIRFIEENTTAVRQMLADRNYTGKVDLDALLSAVANRRKAISELDELRARRNRASEEVAKLKKSGGDAGKFIEEVRSISGRIKELEEAVRQAEEEIEHINLLLPNMLHSSTPIGKTAEDNVELKRWGEPPTFNFTPRPHWELGTMHGLLDFERAAKISGAMFACYFDRGARLERAMINLMLDMHTTKHGYTEVLAPFLVNADSMQGTGQLPHLRDDMYKIEDADYFLIPTAEVSVTNLHKDEIIPEAELPKRYCSYSACFRREAGAAGRDTRGLMRMHQFNKVELVKITRTDNSYEELDKLLLDAEAVMQALELPYRVISLCSGDIGFGAAKCYDIEVWLPSEERYREISSCSNYEEFQARRARIRMRRESDKKAVYAHTMNGSGIALSRAFVALLENHQQKDGSIKIPQALQPYFEGRERIG
jgi:seryl-tRNA synthetase